MADLPALLTLTPDEWASFQPFDKGRDTCACGMCRLRAEVLAQAAQRQKHERQRDTERHRIVRFLWDVYGASTHGASNLMERAIQAVEDDAMADPVAVARPYQRVL